MTGLAKALGAVALVALGIPVGIVVNNASQRLPDLRATYRQGATRIPPSLFTKLDTITEKAEKPPPFLKFEGAPKEMFNEWHGNLNAAVALYRLQLLMLREGTRTGASLTVANAGKTVAKNVRLTVPGASEGTLGVDKKLTQVEGDTYLIGDMQPSDVVEVSTWGNVIYANNPPRLRSDEGTGAVIDAEAPVKSFWEANGLGLIFMFSMPLIFFIGMLRDKIKEAQRAAADAQGFASRWQASYEELRTKYLDSLKKPPAGGDAGFPRGG